MKKNEPTEEDFARVLAKLKAKDELFDLHMELGKFLTRHIDDLTAEERARYDELLKILSAKSENN